MLFTHFGVSGRSSCRPARICAASAKRNTAWRSTSSPRWTKRSWTRASCAIFEVFKPGIQKTRCATSRDIR